MAKQQKQYTVEGTITNQNDQPIKGVMVRATDQDPNTPENLLGTPVYTDDKGKYKIIYKDEDFRIGGRESDRGEKPSGLYLRSLPGEY